MFDGHGDLVHCLRGCDRAVVPGGIAVAERLEVTFSEVLDGFWSDLPPETATAKAFVEMDRKLLQQAPGFFGTFGERGVGGSKCGATGAVAVIFRVSPTAMSANKSICYAQ